MSLSRLIPASYNTALETISGLKCEVLVIAGGGSGGPGGAGYTGGGGGAGEVVHAKNIVIPVGSNAVEVGAGGATDGSATSFSEGSPSQISKITAIGGGCGGVSSNNPGPIKDSLGKSGGSGGGGSNTGTSSTAYPQGGKAVRGNYTSNTFDVTYYGSDGGTGFNYPNAASLRAAGGGGAGLDDR